MKKIIAGLLAFTSVLFPAGMIQEQPLSCSGIITAHAETAIWNGTADTSWYYQKHTVITQENGREVSVFNISTPEELAGLAKLVRNGNEMRNTMINLTADIALNDTSNYENWDTEEPANNWIAIGAAPMESVHDGEMLCNNFCGIFNFSIN